MTYDRSAVMRAVKSRDTGPERAVRGMLRPLAPGYRLHRADLPGKPDIVYAGRKLAIFVHGCFWHGHDCPRGARMPKANADYWAVKIARNRARDERTLAAYSAMGWHALVVHECELKDQASLAARLAEALLQARSPTALGTTEGPSLARSVKEDPPMETAQEYYRNHGPMTAPGAEAAMLAPIPRDIATACSAIQGALIHRDIAPWLYDIKLSEEARDLANVRPVAGMLPQIRALSDRPLTEAREPKHRMPAVCRHFATMLSAILREQGVPARARCGFGAYFNPGRFEDHWVAEYWNSAQNRWILVDAQLDAVQRKTFKPGFDPLDVPRDGFIVAGDAWRQCRSGQADPNLFGLSFMNEQGLWWVAQNLIRDLAALNRMEMLPWDVWGAMPKPTTEITDSEINLLDRVSEITLAGDHALPDLRQIYQDERLRVSEVIFNASRQKQEKAEP